MLFHLRLNNTNMTQKGMMCISTVIFSVHGMFRILVLRNNMAHLHLSAWCHFFFLGIHNVEFKHCWQHCKFRDYFVT